MSKKGGTQVEAVDPWEMGRADATFNRIDTYTPFGQLTYGGPNRNIANLSLNPYLAGTEDRRMMSDRMLMDMALGRQYSMQQGGLPALTTGINPGAMTNYFGLPTSLQSGSDRYPAPGNIPNLTGTPSGGKGGTQRPMPPGEYYEGGGPNQGRKGGTFAGNIANNLAATRGLDPQRSVGYMGSPASPTWGGRIPGAPSMYASDIDNRTTGAPTYRDWTVKGAPDRVLNTGGSKGGANGQPVFSGGGGGPQTVTNQPQDGFGGSIGSQLDPLGTTSRPQGVYDSTNFADATRRASDVLNRIDPNTFGQIGSLDQLQDFDLDRNRVEQNFFDRTASLLQPQYDQQEQRMVSNLRARGIPRGSEAWDREMANFERNKGETFGRLANQAVLSGGGEQSRLFGISSALGDRPMTAAQQLFGMSSDLGTLGLGAQGQQFGQAGQLAGMESGAQQQLFNMADQLAQRDIQAQLQNANIASMNRATQFNELASLLGLQQVASPGLNNFFAPGNVDMMGAYGLNQNAQAQNARNSAAQKGGMLGGLGQLGGAAIGAGGWGGLFGMGQ
jgi:hypothetical protein